MRIFQTSRHLSIDGGAYHPFVRYIVSDWEAAHIPPLVGGSHPDVVFDATSVESWVRRPGGADLSGKRVLMYRHKAFGDMMIATAIPHYIKQLYPDCIINVYCHPDAVCIWDGNKDIVSAPCTLPIPFDIVHMYDYHILYEGMLEENKEPDQRNCYDDMFNFIGLRDVPDRFKRPHLVEAAADRHEVYETMGKRLLTQPYIIYHWGPNNPNRCYPKEKGFRTVVGLSKAFPSMKIVVVGQEDNPKEYMDYKLPGESLSNVVFKLEGFNNFRALIPLVANAKLVICPDSSVSHLAGAFPEVPTISLWGLFAPKDRVKYYTNHYPIFHKDVCPHAPCHNHDFELPLGHCKDATDKEKEDIKYCPVLDHIEPDEIIEKAKTLI